MYFFTPRDRKYPEGERPKRSVDGNGFWKASGKAEEVENFDILIAKKRSLVYYQGSYKKPKKTDWLMQEFFMTGSSSSSARKGRPHNMKVTFKDWIFLYMHALNVYRNQCNDILILWTLSDISREFLLYYKYVNLSLDNLINSLASFLS